MIQYENECVNCGLPCLEQACPYKNVAHYYCDNCGSEIVENSVAIFDDHYTVGEYDYCDDCYSKLFSEKDEDYETNVE